MIQGTARNSRAATSKEFLPHTEASSFILALGSSAASKEDRALATQPWTPGPAGQRPEHRGTKTPGATAARSSARSPVCGKGCSTAQPWHSAPAPGTACASRQQMRQKHSGCRHGFSHLKAGAALSPHQVQVRAVGKWPRWLLVRGNFGSPQGKRSRAWRGAQHCRLLLRAFNEVSMFHFRDKRAQCHTGGPRWGEIKKHKLHSSLHPIQEHNVNIMPI